ncbi:MAG: glycosyltransferase [Saprospiraceae bacterium]
MDLTIVISYYRAIQNLKIILKALANQSFRNFEVIVSEDDYNVETIAFISENSKQYPFSLKHIHQTEDIGFRKNMMLNKCLQFCQTEKIVFIDGDCIPHRFFTEAYCKHIQSGYFYAGRSVMMDQKISDEIVKNQSLHKLNLFALLFTNSQKVKDAIYSPYFPLTFKNKGLVGRNWGILRKHLLEINGFDEDYIEAGVGEDVDIEWRLIANGIKGKSIKNKAITFHIFHKQWYSEEKVQYNFDLMYEKQRRNLVKCLNGIEKLI